VLAGDAGSGATRRAQQFGARRGKPAAGPALKNEPAQIISEQRAFEAPEDPEAAEPSYAPAELPHDAALDLTLSFGPRA